MKILVTGCTGFVGSNLIGLLLKKGHRIYCISRKNTCTAGARENHLQYDLSERLNYSELPTNLDCIIHLAATMDKTTKASDLFLINVSSTLNLLEYGKEIGIRKFVLASSGAVYGCSQEPLSEDSPISPIDFYGLSKYQSELLVNHYSQQFSTMILRLSFPYGPGQVRGIVPQLTNKIKHKEPIIIYNGDCPKIKPMYVTDVTKVIGKALELEGNHTLNICSDEVITIKALSLLIGQHLGLEPIFRHVRDANMKDLIVVNTKMKQCLDCYPTVTLKQGIQHHITWMELRQNER